MNQHMNRISVRVYYEDTDCGNVVYYANYLKYMERGRTEYLRDLGCDLFEMQKQDTLFVVAEANVKYHRSALYNDLLTVTTSVVETSSVCVIFKYEIINQNNVLCVSGTIKAACVSCGGKVKRIPTDVYQKLQEPFKN